MKKIGVLFGMENTFPPALVDKINSMQVPDVHAEAVQLGGVKMAVPSGGPDRQRKGGWRGSEPREP